MIIPHCLTIAGSDSGGGAGIQGDLKTFTVLGAYGMAVITALTAQNTAEVRGVRVAPADFVRLQLAAVLDDIRCDAAKTGMLATAEIVHTVANELRRRERFPLVADPVMVSTSGARLLEEDAAEAVRVRLLPLCAVATPNAPEAEILTGITIRTIADAERAAREIHAMGAAAVLVKGGDIEYEPDVVTDVLYDGVAAVRLRSPRIAVRTTHGSGCALASAICVGLARGRRVHEAVDFARRFVASAIAEGRIIGRTAGPVNHLCRQP